MWPGTTPEESPLFQQVPQSESKQFDALRFGPIWVWSKTPWITSGLLVVREQSDLTCSLYGAFRLIELRQDFADPRKETFSPLFEHRADIGRSEDSGVFVCVFHYQTLPPWTGAMCRHRNEGSSGFSAPPAIDGTMEN